MKSKSTLLYVKATNRALARFPKLREGEIYRVVGQPYLDCVSVVDGNAVRPATFTLFGDEWEAIQPESKVSESKQEIAMPAKIKIVFWIGMILILAPLMAWSWKVGCIVLGILFILAAILSIIGLNERGNSRTL